jgi:photosystem II stability/assembly factor-like uncharacterized protein
MMGTTRLRFRGALLALALGLLLARPAGARQWQPTTAELLRKEKTGFGGLCGVAIDRKTGDVYVNLSDRGVFRSTDQGKSWKRVGGQVLKGRTEWPGCMLFDPVGPGKTLLVALVYGSPVAVSPDAGATWKIMNAKSSHVDWCAVDWSDPDRQFVLALKHESGGLLLVSRDGGKSFGEVGKGHGPAWIFDAKTAVVAEAPSKARPKPGLLRTTDAGRTFRRCGEYRATALPRWRGGTLYWVVQGALIASTDRGASWKKLSDLKEGRCGPVFGKGGKHLFVLTGAGVVESTDGGGSWSRPIPLPRELGGLSALSWLEYDPVNDVLYVMKMGSQLYKLPRQRS